MQEATDEKLLDVAEEFTALNQTDSYQTAYRHWRKREKNPYAFSFIKNPKESAFSENQAVVSSTPAQAEQSALRNLGILFGTAFLCYLLIENLLDKILVQAARMIGVQIETMYWGETHYYGDDLTVFLFSAALQILKLLIPILMIGLALQMPIWIAVPLPVKHTRQMLNSISLMMLLSVGLGSSMTSRSSELEKYRIISDAVGADDHWLILYIVFTVFIVPLFWELLFHGAMFQSLRQFGDTFAVIAVTSMATLLTHNLQDAVRLGLVTLSISFFMVRTGSFLTAVILRIIHEIYMFALFQIENYEMLFTLRWWIVILFPCLIGLLTIIVLTISEKGNEENVNPNKDYLSLADQFMIFSTTLPMLVTIIVCILLFVMTAMLA
ncbi:MAG: CPBP family intramembrane metalloprotease [Oscillospiraceae bacterium]|nr:CPBP family intramembrane metalloprotease [Oscillospiraceae bacterium]